MEALLDKLYTARQDAYSCAAKEHEAGNQGQQKQFYIIADAISVAINHFYDLRNNKTESADMSNWPGMYEG